MVEKNFLGGPLVPINCMSYGSTVWTSASRENIECLKGKRPLNEADDAHGAIARTAKRAGDAALAKTQAFIAQHAGTLKPGSVSRENRRKRNIVMDKGLMSELAELAEQNQIKKIININRDDVIGIVTERLTKTFVAQGVADCPQYFVNITEDPNKFMQFIFAGEPESTENFGEVSDQVLDES